MKRDKFAELDGDAHDWATYWAELWLHQREVQRRTPYLPSPSDIPNRCKDILWLERNKFPRKFIVNVMEYENPSIDRVRQMVERHGVNETYQRCKHFLLETEYDTEQRNSMR